MSHYLDVAKLLQVAPVEDVVVFVSMDTRHFDVKWCQATRWVYWRDDLSSSEWVDFSAHRMKMIVNAIVDPDSIDETDTFLRRLIESFHSAGLYLIDPAFNFRLD